MKRERQNLKAPDCFNARNTACQKGCCDVTPSSSARCAMEVERSVLKKLASVLVSSLMLLTIASAAHAQPRPNPPGKLVNLGGHRLHVNCTGSGSPTVVVENGLGDFSLDWVLVQ